MEIREVHCNVCNCIFDINKGNTYQTKVENTFFNSVNIYDATDCPYCGCQNLLKKDTRK